MKIAESWNLRTARKTLQRAGVQFVERLESRWLLSAFPIAINFQPESAAVPDGYLADTGAVFGDRGNGFTYGWNGPHNAKVVARHLRKPTDGTDNRFDTFAAMHAKGRGSTWQIEVPDGVYQIDMTAGDPRTNTGRYVIDINQATIVDGKASRGAGRWITGSVQVSVSDGLLTLTVPKGRSAKIDFLQIAQVVTSPTPTPTTPPASFTTGQIIPAAQYSAGGEGMGYHDTTPANLGGDPYRYGDGVDIIAGGTTAHVVDFTDIGEWLDYTVDVSVAGAYTLSASAANNAAGASFHATLGGADVTGPLTVPNTGDLSVFATVTSGSFNLAAGPQTLRIFFDQTAPNGTAGNFDWFEIATPSVVQPPTDTPFTTPFATNHTIPAAQYDNGGEGVSYHDTTPTNLGGDTYRSGDAVDIATGGSTGNVVTDIAAGEWLNYTIDVATAGSYALSASVANSAAGGSFHAEVNGSNLSGAIPIPNTADLTTYQMVTSSSFTLAAGVQVLHVYFDTAATTGSAGNVDWLKLIPASTSVLPPLVWTTLHKAPQGLVEAQSATANGKLYVFGGYNVTNPNYLPTAASEVFDPVKNTWTILAPMPVAETHMGVTSDGTYVYVAGGYTIKPGTAFQIFGTTNVFRYNIATNSWSTFVPLPAAIGAGTLVLVGTELNFFDGVNPSRIGQTEHWTLDLSSTNPAWIDATPPPFSRNHMVPVVMDNKIYAMGGQPGDNDSQTTTDALEWDPANPSVWTILPNMPIARSHAVSAVVDGKIMILGGTTTNDVPISSVVSYDPISNKWSTQTSLPSPRLAAVGGVLGNQLIVTTGFGPDGLETTTWSATI